MEISFNGKRALVTGGSQGIGKAIAIQLLKCGATVVVLDINKNNLALLKTEHPGIETTVADLSDWNATKQAIMSLLPIDLLVNNAGIAFTNKINEITPELYDKMFNINVKALMNVTQSVVDNLLSRKVPGSIVNISSQASKAALLHHTLYSATKSAIDGYTRSAALEVGPNNIRINCINPTVVMTELGRKIWDNPEMGGPMLAKIPLNRFAEVTDVVDSVIFLLSDKARMITGTCLPVDGGFLAC